MNSRFILRRFLSLAASLAAGVAIASAAEFAKVDLAGRWRFTLDPADAGVKESWFKRSLPEQIQLPGVLQAQGFGNAISTNTPWVLSLYDRLWYLRADYLAYTQPEQAKVPFVCQPPRHYLGAAWYQHDLPVPEEWQGRRLALCLERPHWESTVWLDDVRVGSCNSLVAAHDYDLGLLPAGRHTLTIRVDNRMVMPYRPDAHSVSDSLASSWNGIVGRIEVTPTSRVWIEDAQVFPDVAKKSARIKVRIGNAGAPAGSGTLSAGGASTPASWGTNGGDAELEVALGPDAQLWDEFHPALQRLNVQLKGERIEHHREVVFGLREFRAAGQDFLINGRKTHLRGTHHGGDFPLTGYPPTDVDYWRKLWATCKDWGLNHVRFHSFCPPEAAFAAADELGLYLQVEPGMWNEISPGTPMEAMLYAETERILKAFGNHPSLVLVSASNEPKGAWKKSLPAWVEHFRALDPRHLYTTGTGWSLIDQPGPVLGADFLAVHRIGLKMLRGNSAWFGRDYAESLRGVNVPVVSHELGQWCAYPDYDVIRKFTGYMRPGNYEIFRDSLARHGLLERNRDLAWASGRFQFLCYKEEIEANLRTPGLAGFQLLDLHDYVGQGTALVGLLDPFWEPKGYVSDREFRRFCTTTVPLARLSRRVWTGSDRFEVPVEVAHYGAAPLTNAACGWRILDAANAVVSSGRWPAQTIPHGRSTLPGLITADLARLAAPRAYRLAVTIEPRNGLADTTGRSGEVARAFENDWRFWLYPPEADGSSPAEVLVTSAWREASARLAAGGRVLFLPRAADLDWSCPPLDAVPVFWNRLMNPGWGRMLGLWCQTNHPALAGFPTEANCDWQWTELLRRARAINLDRLPPRLHPIVQAIDDWNRNYKLGLIFECGVGPGRLLVCSLDVQSELGARPVARQLRRSLLDYLASPRFAPEVAVSPDALNCFLFDTRVMRKLGAQAQADGADASPLVDGDPNTFWAGGGGKRGGQEAKHPHDITVHFPHPVTMNGVVLLNRQNDRDHLGDIRSYRFQASDDGNSWREVARGELASTWNPQTVTFAASVTARHLKLTALSGFGADSSAALAELAVLYEGAALPDNSGGEIEYKRVRSTSSDVDEGTPRPRPAP